MALLDELKLNGCDVDSGIERFMGNAAIYEKMIRKLPESIKKQNVKTVFESGNSEDAINATHAIKGTSGNLSITPIYEAYAKMVELLRAGSFEEAHTLYINTIPVEEKILNIIERA